MTWRTSFSCREAVSGAGRSGRLLGAATLVLGLMLALLSVARPASACQCGTGTAREAYAEAEAVYVARPNGSLPLMGTWLDVERVLKGPLRETIRVTVDDVSSCATRLHEGIQVLRIHDDPNPVLHACSGVSPGEEGVARAIRILGEGTLMPDVRGPPVLLPLAAVVAMAGVLLRLAIGVRRRTSVGQRRVAFEWAVAISLIVTAFTLGVVEMTGVDAEPARLSVLLIVATVLLLTLASPSFRLANRERILMSASTLLIIIGVLGSFTVGIPLLGAGGLVLASIGGERA